MSPELQQLLGVAIALGSGAVTKQISKANNGQAHKALSPVVAATAAGVWTAITGDQATLAAAAEGGVELGAVAVLTHTLAKNAGGYLLSRLGRLLGITKKAR